MAWTNYSQGAIFSTEGSRLIMDAGPAANVVTGGVASNDGAGYKVLHGRLRGTVAFDPSDNTPGHIGLVVMQSEAELAFGGTGKAYGLILDTVLSQNKIELIQVNTGISASPGSALSTSYTVLAASDNMVISVGVPYLLDLEWESDPDILHGVRLQATVTQPGGDVLADWDIVYTGSAAYMPTDAGDLVGCGVLLSMATNRVKGNFQNVAVAH